MESARSEEWSKSKLKIIFLTPHDSSDTLILPNDIDNDLTSASKKGTAFTQSQRYVSLSRLEKGPKNTSELVWVVLEHIVAIENSTGTPQWNEHEATKKLFENPEIFHTNSGKSERFQRNSENA